MPIERLILRGLVRKLIAKNPISTEDLRTILFEAAVHKDLADDRQPPKAVRIAVEEDLLPSFALPPIIVRISGKRPCVTFHSERQDRPASP